MTSHIDTVVNNKGKMPWYVYFIGAAIYASCRLDVRRIVSSGMDLPHQCTIGVLLCLGGLETRRSETEVTPNPVLERQMTKADTSRQQWNGERRF